MAARPVYINEKEVAEMTSLSVSTLRNQRFQGTGLPFYKMARAVRYKLTDVTSFMDSCLVETANPWKE